MQCKAPWPNRGPENKAIDNIVHVIQVALTPVFLLTGLASLLNVFASRLARVADKVDALTDALDSASEAERNDNSEATATARRARLQQPAYAWEAARLAISKSAGEAAMFGHISFGTSSIVQSAQPVRDGIVTGDDFSVGNVARAPLPLETSMPGVFAIGDVRAQSTKRVGAAIGEGAAVVAQIHQVLAASANF